MKRVKLHTLIVLKKSVKPGDEEWERAKFLLRSTGLMVVTAADHLAWGHLIYSNHTNIAASECLEGHHPIRRLLQVHLYHAAYVNSTATVLLIPYGGSLSRNLAFTHDSLPQVLDISYKSLKYETFPQFLKRQGMDKVDPDLFPMALDGLEYYQIVYKYVHDYVNIYYKNDGAVEHDAQIQEFWKKLTDLFPCKLPSLSKDALIQYITQFIFTVSGWHSQAGNVSAYFRDPAFAAPACPEGLLMSYPPMTFIQTLIAVGTAGNMPQVTDDWSHLMLDDESKKVLSIFRQELIELSKVIDSRNEKRICYNNFNPKYIHSSISV